MSLLTFLKIRHSVRFGDMAVLLAMALDNLTVKVVDCVQMNLGRPDVLPVDDLGLPEGVRTAYKLEFRPTRKEMLEHHEAGCPYRTSVTWYM
jgi:hypothetical protein